MDRIILHKVQLSIVVTERPLIVLPHNLTVLMHSDGPLSIVFHEKNDDETKERECFVHANELSKTNIWFFLISPLYALGCASRL